MVIELTGKVESELRKAARAEGLSVSLYIQKLVAQTNLRRAQLVDFKAAIAERIASLDAGEGAAGAAPSRCLWLFGAT